MDASTLPAAPGGQTARRRLVVGGDAVLGWLAQVAPGARARRRILVTSLPKAGTNLAVKALAGLPGTRMTRTWLVSRTAPAPRGGRDRVPVGVDWPVAADLGGVRRLLAAVPRGGIALGHLPWSAPLARLVEDLDMAVVVALRDPRDVVLSLAHYVPDRSTHPLHARFLERTPDERIAIAADGLAPDASGAGLRPIEERVGSMAAWLDEPSALLARFEDLVGAQGGGDGERQLQLLETMATHVGAAASPTELAAVAEGLFGGTDTFRRGRIEGWRDGLDPDQVTNVEARLGPMLGELGYRSAS